MNKPRACLLPLLIFVLSFSLNLSLISKGPYNVDCLHLALKSQETFETLELKNLFGTGYPLTIILGAVFIFFARLLNITDPVIAVNLMSVVFGALSVCIFFLLAKKLFNDESTAIFSTIILALCPIFMGVSVYGKSHAPTMFFLMLGILFLLKFLETGKRKELLLGGIFIGCMGANRLHEMILIGPAITLLLWFTTEDEYSLKNKKLRTESLVIFWATACLVTVMFHLPYIFNQESHFYSGQFFHFIDIAVTKNFKLLISPSLLRQLYFMIINFSAVGFILIFIGLVLLFKNRRKLFWIFIAWIFFPFFFYANLQASVPRFLVILLPVFTLSIGYVFSILKKHSDFAKGASFMLFLIIIYMTFGHIYPLLKFRHNNAVLPHLAVWIRDKIEPNARIIATDERLFYAHYAKLSSMGRPVHWPITTEDLLNFKKELDSELEKGTPVYITTVALYAYNREDVFSNFFKEHYKGVLVGEHLFDDWHTGFMIPLIFSCDLYRVYKK